MGPPWWALLLQVLGVVLLLSPGLVPLALLLVGAIRRRWKDVPRNRATDVLVALALLLPAFSLLAVGLYGILVLAILHPAITCPGLGALVVVVLWTRIWITLPRSFPA